MDGRGRGHQVLLDMRASWDVMTCATACNVLYFEVEEVIIMAPGVNHISAHPHPTSSNGSTTSLGTISSTLFLNQNIASHAMRHFGSCHLDLVLSPLGWDGVRLCQPTKG